MAAPNGNVLSTGNGTSNGVAPNGNGTVGFTPEAGFDPKANKIVNIGALRRPCATYHCRGQDSLAQKVCVAADEQLSVASVACSRYSCIERFPGVLPRHFSHWDYTGRRLEVGSCGCCVAAGPSLLVSLGSPLVLKLCSRVGKSALDCQGCSDAYWCYYAC